MIQKFVCRLTFVLITSLNLLQAKDYSGNNFFIKKEYISRSSYTHFDDTPLKDEFQDDVYLAAHQLKNTNGFTKIGDIGCGSGFKLIKYFDDCDTLGFEIQPTLNFLLQKYPSKNWCLSDFSRLPQRSTFDVLISADVIEHLVNPDDLLNWIDQFDFKYLVISTPDRAMLNRVWTDNFYGPQTQTGPPVNMAHVREWDFEEFETYISQYFDVVDHFHSKRELYGQVVIAVKKSMPEKKG